MSFACAPAHRVQGVGDDDAWQIGRQRRSVMPIYKRHVVKPYRRRGGNRYMCGVAAVTCRHMYMHMHMCMCMCVGSSDERGNRLVLAHGDDLYILSQILGQSGKPAREIFRPGCHLPPTTTTTEPGHSAFECVHHASAGRATARPRCWRAGARSRRAGGARSWRSCDAARALASLRVTPCRHSARAWWRRRHRGPRGVPARVPTSWRDRSAPSAGAMSRFRERAGRRRLAKNACSPAPAEH